MTSLFESIQEGISIMKPDLTILHVNGIMKEWYKGNLPLEGKKCYEAYQKSDKPCDPCPSLRCLKSGNTEFNIVPGLPGSPVKWIELYSYPIKDNKETNSDEPTGVIEFVRDITKRTRVEKELKKKMSQLELFNKIAVDRELKMVELKKEVDDLLEMQGLDKKYSTPG